MRINDLTNGVGKNCVKAKAAPPSCGEKALKEEWGLSFENLISERSSSLSTQRLFMAKMIVSNAIKSPKESQIQDWETQF